MEKFKTYRTKDGKEYASWQEDYLDWFTHSVPQLYPMTHDKDGFVEYMKRTHPNFSVPDHIELIEVEVIVSPI